MDCLDFVAGYFEFDDGVWVSVFVEADFSLLYQAVSGHDNEEFPLAVVPVLPFCDAGLADVDGYLAVVNGFEQFCEAAAVVDIHFQIESNFIFGR